MRLWPTERTEILLCMCVIGLAVVRPAHGYSPNDVIAGYAGNGTSGYSGDGGPAVIAMLSMPEDTAVDNAGNLYVSDVGNGTIRKINTAGIITTIAGTGTPGYNGDNIPATTAQVSPRGITFDSAGNLYIADIGNNRIRKITFSTGLISTVAGTGASGCSNGVAAQAVFNAPVGVAFDAAGTLYISEIGNRIARKLSGGSVSVFAGTCTTQAFKFPGDLATDSANNVYIVDQGSGMNGGKVWKYDTAGNGTLFAGNGSNGNSGDGSPANSAGVAIDQPYGIARDAAGNVFIASGSVVRVVTPDGVIHTSTGTNAAGSSGDGSLATSAQLKFVQGLAVNAAGRLYIVDQLAADVRIVGPAAPLHLSVKPALFSGVDSVLSADGRISCPGTCGANYVAGMPVLLNDPTPIFDFLYEWTYLNCRGTTCTVYPQTSVTSVSALFTPTYIKTLFGGNIGPPLHHPFALAIDSHHNFYFSELDSCTVRERTASGSIITVAGNGICGNIGDGIQATQAELSNPQGVAIAIDGTIYIQDTGNAVIRKVSPGGVFTTFATGLFTGTNSPAIALDANNNLYMPSSAHDIVRIEPNGVQLLFASFSSGPIETIRGLAIGPDGTLFVYGSGQEGEQTFELVPPSGTSTFYVSYFNGASNSTPTGMAIDASGALYSADDTCALNVIIAAFGTAEYVPSSSCLDSGDGDLAVSGSINHPVGMAIDSNGYLYVVSAGGNSIRVIFPDAIFTAEFEN